MREAGAAEHKVAGRRWVWVSEAQSQISETEPYARGTGSSNPTSSGGANFWFLSGGAPSVEAMLTAGSYGEGHLFPTERGTPQGGVASPLLSNILLTPFDREMRRKGYQLTRYADDWVVTCVSAAEARAALEAASRILKELGVTINPQKTRIGARRRRRSRRRPVWTTCCLPCRGRMSRRPCGACPSGNGRVLIDATNPFTETSLKLVLADLGGTGATSASSGSPQSLSTSPRSMPRPQRALDVVSDPVPKAPAPSTTVMFTEASNTRRCWGWR